MVANSVKMVASSLVVLGTLAMPAVGSAQGYSFGNDDRSVVVECGPGQRAVMEQRSVNGGPRHRWWLDARQDEASSMTNMVARFRRVRLDTRQLVPSPVARRCSTESRARA